MRLQNTTDSTLEILVGKSTICIPPGEIKEFTNSLGNQLLSMARVQHPTGPNPLHLVFGNELTYKPPVPKLEELDKVPSLIEEELAPEVQEFSQTPPAKKPRKKRKAKG